MSVLQCVAGKKLMLQELSKWLLYKVMGWKKNITIVMPEKFIICLAPHTSNWDFIIGQLYSHAEGIKINYLIKKEWFVGPLAYFFRSTGGIPVLRQKHTSMTDSLAETARREDSFRLCITPEGTRSLNPNWKKGFYYVALKADIPVLLYGLDFNRKLIECTRELRPTGEFDREMAEIKQYYINFKGKHPERFAV